LAQAAMRPASIVMRRSQRVAMARSCVTSTSVVPCSRFSSNIRSITVCTANVALNTSSELRIAA